jgi:multidrug efflux pump subunit AcrA (membrane-fusion protein)
VRGRALLRNDNGVLASGMFGRIRVPRDKLANATTLPEEAILSDRTRKYVLAVNAQNIVEPHPVQLGPVSDGRRVVTGIDPSARVIVNGGSRVFPGMPVKPQLAGAESAPAAAGGG